MAEKKDKLARKDTQRRAAAGEERPVPTIDAEWLRRALTAGIHRVIGKRDYINRINVFPVADADTGTNLAFTLHALLGAMREPLEMPVAEFLRQIADLALDSARGNSGAIFAQYLQGFSEAVDDRADLDAVAFAEAALTGATSARGAIAEPREGTMLSVIRDHAQALVASAAGGVEAFGPFLAEALAAARTSLAHTPDQLEVLRQNNVVDAGAQGFVEVLEGIQAFADSGAIPELGVADESLAEDEIGPAIEAHESEHRFCTECVISGAAIDRKQLRERIQEFGASSLVIAGTKQKVRVHVHVDNPGALFMLCEDFGRVSSQKADDMAQQQRATRAVGRPVAVMVDTGADIPEGEVERLRIHLVPLRVNFGDRQYLDKVSLTPSEFYEKLRQAQQPPRTSQPPPGDFRRLFEYLGSHFSGTVCLNISSALSGTWQAADGAARRVRYEPVTAFDTLNASAGQGLLAMYAAEAAQAGASHAEVIELLEGERPKVETFAVLSGLDYAVRGGRLPGWVRSVAKLLGMVPVIANNRQGRIQPRGALFGRSRLPGRFARWITRRLDPAQAYRILIAHCDDAEGARELRDQLVRRVPRVHSAYRTEAGTALGAHAGPGTLIVAVQPYRAPGDRLQDLREGAA